MLPPIGKWHTRGYRATPKRESVSDRAGIPQRRHSKEVCASQWRKPKTPSRSVLPSYGNRCVYTNSPFPVPTITVSMADEYVLPVLPSIMVTTHDIDCSPSFRQQPVGPKGFLSIDDARRSFGSDLVKMAALSPDCAPSNDTQGNRDSNTDHSASQRVQLNADVTSVRNDVIHVGKQTEDNSERATASYKGSDYERFGDWIRVDTNTGADSRKDWSKTDNDCARNAQAQVERSGGSGVETDGGMENGSEFNLADGCWGTETRKPGDEEPRQDTRKNENNANIAAYDSSASVSVSTISDITDAGAVCFEFGNDEYKGIIDVCRDETAHETCLTASNAAERGVSTQTDADTDDDEEEENDDDDDDDDENDDVDDDGADWCLADDPQGDSKVFSASPSLESPDTSNKSPRPPACASAAAVETAVRDMTSTDAHGQEDDDDEGCVLTTDAELADSDPSGELQGQPVGVSDCSETATITKAVHPHVVSSNHDDASPLPLDPVELADTNASSPEHSSEVSPCWVLGKSRSECYATGATEAESKSGIPVLNGRHAPTKAKSVCEDLTRSRSVRASRQRKSGSPISRKASIPRPIGRASSVMAMGKPDSTVTVDKLDQSWTDTTRSDSDGGDASRRRRRSSKQAKKTVTTRSRKLTQSRDAGSPRMSSGSPLMLVRTRFKEAVVTKPADIIFTICGNVNSDSSVTRHGRVPVVQSAAPCRRQHSAETTKSRLKCEAYCYNDGMMQVTMRGSLRQLKPIVAASSGHHNENEVKCAPTLQVEVVVERDPLGSGRDPPKIPKSVYRKPASPPKKRRPRRPTPPDRNILDTRATGPSFDTKLPSPRCGTLRPIGRDQVKRTVEKSCPFY